jgi:hypothetical protein
VVYKYVLNQNKHEGTEGGRAGVPRSNDAGLLTVYMNERTHATRAYANHWAAITPCAALSVGSRIRLGVCVWTSNIIEIWTPDMNQYHHFFLRNESVSSLRKKERKKSDVCPWRQASHPIPSHADGEEEGKSAEKNG